MPPLAVDQFTGALNELSARSGEAAAKLVARVSALTATEGRQFITDAYPAMLDPFLSASGELTAQWYAEQPAAPLAPGAAAFAPSPAALPDPKQLAISARWALTQADAEMALRGNAIRQTMNASRETVVANATAEGVRWVRHAQPNACGFCRMLATRSATYSGRGVKLNRKTGQAELRVVGRIGSGRTRGTRKLGEKYHDHCRCTAIPVRDGIYEPPAYVEQWREDYNKASENGNSLTDIVKAMDEPRVRADRAAAKLAKSLAGKTAADAARLVELARATATPPPVNLDVPPEKVRRQFAEVEAEFNAAIEAGDDALINKLADELESIEAAERKAAARRLKAAERKRVLDTAKWEKVSELIDQGADPLEAEAQVFNKSLARLQSRDALYELRLEGYHGNSLRELLEDKFIKLAAEQMRAAEDATNGFMFKAKYMNRIDPFRLWTGTEKQAREWMSEEMAAWFDANGRITKRAVVDGLAGHRNPMTEDFLQ